MEIKRLFEEDALKKHNKQCEHIENNEHNGHIEDNDSNDNNEGHGSCESIEREQFFSRNLLQWYEQNLRDLPWRRTRDPYRIWVSEVMLQQTRVETVIPYYHRFIDKFPTIQALADAPEAEVLKAWEGLGYYSRARNLQSAVREVRENYGGSIPAEKEHISSLRGVGPYTAGAILSIAFNQPEPAVDGNVMRVLARFFVIEDDIAKPATRTMMERLAKHLIPGGRARDFNQALMELGATVCTPKSPYCLTCPVMEKCGARLKGMEHTLPVKTKAKAPRPERRVVALIEHPENKGMFLIRQRPPQGLLASMWELPHYELTAASKDTFSDEKKMKAMLREAVEREGLEIDPQRKILQIGHTFSHIHWEMEVYGCTLQDEAGIGATRDRVAADYRWIRFEEIKQYAFPNVFLKILQHVYRGES